MNPIPLRILGLHGFRTSAAVLEYQSQRLRACLGEAGVAAEFSFLDGPLVSAKGAAAPSIEARFPGQQFFEWWNSNEQADGTVVYDGMEDTFRYVEAHMQANGPFDAVLGFSQGANLAMSLAAGAGSGTCMSSCKLVVLFAATGMRGRPDAPPCSMPSVHVIGAADPYRDKCRNSLRNFENPVLIEHAESHRLPADVEVNVSIAAAIRDVLLEPHSGGGIFQGSGGAGA